VCLERLLGGKVWFLGDVYLFDSVIACGICQNLSENVLLVNDSFGPDLFPLFELISCSMLHGILSS